MQGTGLWGEDSAQVARRSFRGEARGSARRVCVDAGGGPGCGVGQGPGGTGTRDPGPGRQAEVRGGGGRQGRREEAGGRAAPPGSLGTGASGTRPPARASPPRPRRAPRSISRSAAELARGGRRATASASWGGGGYGEEGRGAHLKFRDICSPGEEMPGAGRLGAPTPLLPAVPGTGLPPPAPPPPFPRRRGWRQSPEEGAPRVGSGWGVEFRREPGFRGGVCGAETLKGGCGGMSVCQTRPSGAPQTTP